MPFTTRSKGPLELAATLERILSAARRVIAAAGCTISVVYHWFTSEENVLAWLV